MSHSHCRCCRRGRESARAYARETKQAEQAGREREREGGVRGRTWAAKGGRGEEGRRGAGKRGKYSY